MGRKAKYATLRTYQPYITIIRKQLGIPDTMYIDFQFKPLPVNRNGDATYYNDKHSKVRVNKYLSHNEVIRVLMHELRHIWQYTSGKMEAIYKTVKKRTRTSVVVMKLWDSVEYMDYSAKTRTHYDKYLASPWEVDARDYASKQFLLFPGSKLPEVRKLVGVVGGVTFYKIAS